MVAALALASCGSDRGSLSLTNGASEPIKQASVTVCGQTIEFKDIKPGHSAPACYAVGGDDHFVIDVELASGRRLKKEDGYVTSGMDFHHEIVVTDSTAELILLNSHVRNSRRK